MGSKGSKWVQMVPSGQMDQNWSTSKTPAAALTNIEKAETENKDKTLTTKLSNKETDFLWSDSLKILKMDQNVEKESTF